MKILVTGCAGFIGMHVTKKLLESGHNVVGIDNINDYYTPQLKIDRLKQIENFENFQFFKMTISDDEAITQLFEQHKFQRVVHLAAQAGVRYSITNPRAYIEANITGFFNIIEACRKHKVTHLVYASSSSVYGKNDKLPYSETDQVDNPVSLYAATKKSNELMAFTYSHLYRIPATGLRFFTVYGPWGRPDMSPFIFVKAIIEGKPLKLFNYGNMSRDFTYIDDIVQGLIEVLNRPPEDQLSNVPHRVINIGNNRPVLLKDYIKTIEAVTGAVAKIELAPMQAGDVLSTYADTQLIEQLTKFKPDTPLDVGLGKFVEWYKNYTS